MRRHPARMCARKPDGATLIRPTMIHMKKPGNPRFFCIVRQRSRLLIRSRAATTNNF
ncbi:hypothetical protein CKO_04795 [Citrobacter koseri ATCC BAA-895]|uniref:Uncharacterized protein n=1 Tax=Citrobacter koseri (strain ATCC BAA-895 / CDC 4225-83 / SGSC4696) TaxID=290338 RepID=A8AQS7_CITK8|nr:hypothetical protein CKO_04795 [Citrobacter koseri ATCC BAA-895]